MAKRELLDIFNKSHLFSLPSVTAGDGDMEGTPTSILEAMALGVPVLSTFHSGIPEQIDDGVTGVLVDEHDVPALAAAIVDFIDNPERWAKMALAAREKAVREFDNISLNRTLIEQIYPDAISSAAIGS